MQEVRVDDPGVVDQGVEAACERDGVVDHRLDLLPVAQVGEHDERACTGILDQRRGLLGAIGLHVDHGDCRGPLAGALHRDRAAHSLRGAGDQHALARAHHRSAYGLRLVVDHALQALQAREFFVLRCFIRQIGGGRAGARARCTTICRPELAESRIARIARRISR